MPRTKAVIVLLLFLWGFTLGFDIRDPAPSLLTPESPLYASKIVSEENELNSAADNKRRLQIYDYHLMLRVAEMDAALRRGRKDTLECLTASYLRTNRREMELLRAMAAVGNLQSASLTATVDEMHHRCEMMRKLIDQAEESERRHLKKALAATVESLEDAGGLKQKSLLVPTS